MEQDADAVLLLSNDDSQYLAILAKNKEGRTGKIPITFDKERQRFWKSREEYHVEILIAPAAGSRTITPHKARGTSLPSWRFCSVA